MTDLNNIEMCRQLLARYGDAAWLLVDSRKQADKPGPAIYICDVQSGRTLILETQHDALQGLSENADIDEVTHRQIRSAFSILLGDLLDNLGEIHPDTRRGVILAAALCITETRGFQITRHRGAEVQHLLLRYPNAVDQQYIVTPMPVFKLHPIAAAELNATATHVLLSEQLNFPERFANSQPLSFKETRRNVLAAKR